MGLKNVHINKNEVWVTIFGGEKRRQRVMTLFALKLLIVAPILAAARAQRRQNNSDMNI